MVANCVTPTTLAGEAIERAPRENRVPGNEAVWVGIYAELTEFGLMFLIYFIAKVHYLELFSDGPQQLNTLAGTLNTLALLSSSYCVAKAVACVRSNHVKLAERWLWATVALAVFYLLVKTWEYHWNQQNGIAADTNLFFTVYYYIAFNHFLHVAWGCGAILWAIFWLRSGGYTADDHPGLEAIACYWHMIDLVWIIIFPLLYVLG